MRTIPRGLGASVGRRLTPEPERELPTDPVRWLRDVLDEHPWSKQREIMRSVVTERKTAVPSCHEAGKSYIASRIGAWWIAAHPPGEAMIVTTAPSGDQVRTILWRELQRAHTRGNLPGRILRGSNPEWVLHGEQIGIGRKPADYVDENTARTQFQGLHARYLLGILDEACGVPLWLWQAMDTLGTNEGARFLAIGNPDDPTSEFARKCAPGSGWHVIPISAYETPNFTDERVPEQLRESLVSKRWVEEVERDYGADSGYFIAKVLGEFPEVADDVIVSPKLVREAHERDRSGYAIADPGRMGMDVARYGSDESCIYLNRGGMIRLLEAWRGADVDVSRARAERHLAGPQRREMTVDVVGLGAGVHDPLRNRGYAVRAFSGGEAAYNADRFVNRNSEAWWAFREGMRAGLIDLDPHDEVLAAQLQARKWKLDASQRRIRIETKDEMLKRGVKSPDRADAAVMSFYEVAVTPSSETQQAMLTASADASITGDLLTLRT